MKIKRDAFLYMHSTGNQFAQCETCRFWLGSDIRRCAVLYQELIVDKEDSCGLYVQGYSDKLQSITGVVSPKEAGFVKSTQTRCENCNFYAGKGICGLYKKLNSEVGDEFDLDVKIDPDGCCNAFISKVKQVFESTYRDKRG